MNEFFMNSVYIGVAISLGTYGIGVLIRRKIPHPAVNPLLISILLTIIILRVLKVDYESFNYSAKYISYLITPATVALAIPLYKNLHLLKKNIKAIVIGLTCGTFAGFGAILLLAKLLKLDHQEYVTIIPKSITTAVGMDLSKEMGGIVTITVACIVVTGILGTIIAEPVYKLLKIKHPISKGLGLGASSHVMGTSKAMEIGEIEGAMGSLAIVVCSLITVVGASIFANLG